MPTNEGYHKDYVHTNPPKKIRDVLKGTKMNLDLNVIIFRKLRGTLVA